MQAFLWPTGSTDYTSQVVFPYTSAEVTFHLRNYSSQSYNLAVNFEGVYLEWLDGVVSKLGGASVTTGVYFKLLHVLP